MKAASPMCVTESGMVSSVKPWQSRKALLPMPRLFDKAGLTPELYTYISIPMYITYIISNTCVNNYNYNRLMDVLTNPPISRLSFADN